MTNPSKDQIACRLFEIRQEYQTEVDNGNDANLPGLANEAANLVATINMELLARFQRKLKLVSTPEAIDDVIKLIEMYS